MGYSILMIDDNLADIRLVIEAFKDIEFYDQLECLYAYDGEEAIQLWMLQQKPNNSSI